MFPFGPDPESLLRIAHRGSVRRDLQNTIEGVRESIRQGIHAVELDIQCTREGSLVLFHDRALRLSDGSRRGLASLTMEEIVREPAGRRVPSLATVLELLRDSGTFLVADVKTRESAALLPDVLRESKMADRTLIASFDPAILSAMQGRASELATGLTIGLSRSARTPLGLVRSVRAMVDPVGAARRLGVPSLLLPAPRLTTRLARDARDASIGILVWKLSPSENIERLRGLGVAGLISDLPGHLLDPAEAYGIERSGARPVSP